ncbi:MAG: helix-turn-helix domain-containing protein [bacterium]
MSPSQIGQHIDCERTTVSRICRRFEKRGLDALHDAPRLGAPRRFSPLAESTDSGNCLCTPC